MYNILLGKIMQNGQDIGTVNRMAKRDLSDKISVDQSPE